MMWKVLCVVLSIFFFNTVKKKWVPWKALRSEILPIFFFKKKQNMTFYIWATREGI